MIKFVGIILLLGASFAAGRVLAYQIKQRVNELIYIKKLMLMFRGELDYRNAMLPEAFRAVAAKAREPYKKLFLELASSTEENYTMTMSGLFAEKVDKILEGNTFLKKEDLARFKELGDTLGYQNQKMQLSNIDLYLDRGYCVDVNLIFKIAAVGILVSVISQILKQSGREEHAFLVSLAGLILVLFWIVPVIYDLFDTIKNLFML